MGFLSFLFGSAKADRNRRNKGRRPKASQYNNHGQREVYQARRTLPVKKGHFDANIRPSRTIAQTRLAPARHPPAGSYAAPQAYQETPTDPAAILAHRRNALRALEGKRRIRRSNTSSGYGSDSSWTSVSCAPSSRRSSCSSAYSDHGVGLGIRYDGETPRQSYAVHQPKPRRASNSSSVYSAYTIGGSERYDGETPRTSYVPTRANSARVSSSRTYSIRHPSRSMSTREASRCSQLPSMEYSDLIPAPLFATRRRTNSAPSVQNTVNKWRSSNRDDYW